MEDGGGAAVAEGGGEGLEGGDVGPEEAVVGREGALCESEGSDALSWVLGEESLNESLAYEAFSSNYCKRFEFRHGVRRWVESSLLATRRVPRCKWVDSENKARARWPAFLPPLT